MPSIETLCYVEERIPIGILFTEKKMYYRLPGKPIIKTIVTKSGWIIFVLKNYLPKKN